MLGYNLVLRFMPIDRLVANRLVRSALVVPPDFGGLLHYTRGRLVSSCIQSWGSLCFKKHDLAQGDFQPGLTGNLMSYGYVAIPNSAEPFEAFPSTIALLNNRI